ncbi:TetR/AcrR family transcriptional regulator [Flectobacillus roseus]|uniref:TetR/AcrR family transcriptional regulator n=1 Tax=Flectobacillus roseus TaxID=502259 RepID=UPI0024B8086F|nr:TetR/AcrR family transcriptional regulator [Flectobacillus roseus]MDI9870654.1 TetR/AcrR family transcriptional regulator [Flectobacillus roseus]
MSKAERTRQFIIEKTATLFNSQGYAVTSLSDITALTGLTKGSIYGNFSNKDEVVTEVFKYNASKLLKEIDAAIVEKQSPYEQLLAIVNFYRTIGQKPFIVGGCPLINAATEADDNLAFLQPAVQASFLFWHKKVVDILKRGEVSQHFKSGLDAEMYSSTFIILIEGGILLSRSLKQSVQLDIALDRILKIIEDEIRK